MMAMAPDAMGVACRDVVLPVVPMFHANCWGLALTSPMTGATMVMPGAKLDGPSIYELLNDYRVTFSAAVPTVWLMLLQHLEATGAKLPHLRKVVIGGSACPRAMTKTFQEDYGVEVCHAWGMTEMSPLGSLGSLKPEYAKLGTEERLDVQMKQGHPPFGVEMKITDDADKELPRDGKTFGRLKVRGAAVARAYFKEDDIPILDKDGFFDTGDVSTIDRYGYMQITDRAKDVIKSGGEWISSIDLENLAVGHPKVAEAAVIGVRHPKVGRAAAAGHRAEEGPDGDPRGDSRLHARQDRQLVDAGRRRLRRRDPAHRHRQDPEDGAAQPVQGLHPAERRGVGLLHLSRSAVRRHPLSRPAGEGGEREARAGRGRKLPASALSTRSLRSGTLSPLRGARGTAPTARARCDRPAPAERDRTGIAARIRCHARIRIARSVYGAARSSA